MTDKMVPFTVEAMDFHYGLTGDEVWYRADGVTFGLRATVEALKLSREMYLDEVKLRGIQGDECNLHEAAWEEEKSRLQARIAALEVEAEKGKALRESACLLYTSPSPRD